jgi:hypothetical protein
MRKVRDALGSMIDYQSIPPNKRNEPEVKKAIGSSVLFKSQMIKLTAGVRALPSANMAQRFA